jgi:predicted lipoprotein with Yx(FWY)xxD motif
MTRLLARLPVLALAAAGAIGLSACGSGTSSAPPPAAPAAPASAGPEGTVLTAATTPQLGTFVVDREGFTLYRFDKDTPKPPKSTCEGDCAAKWPPVLATPGSPLTVEGVPQEAVGTVARSDGSVQLTIGGWPVYRFSGDTAPGASAGQGVGGVWAAVTPEGKKAVEKSK